MCDLETGSLNVTLCPLVHKPGMVCTVGRASRIRLLDWNDVEILYVMSSCDKNSLVLVLSVSFKAYFFAAGLESFDILGVSFVGCGGRLWVGRVRWWYQVSMCSRGCDRVII